MATKPVIEKGVPVPASSAGRPNTYPFKEMEVGDSFFVPNPKYAGVYSSAKLAGVKVTSRRVNENGTDGLRVWRIG